MKGGFIHRRHDEIRNIFAEMLQQVCNDVAVESPLMPLTGERLNLRSANIDDEARLDIRARSFWMRGEQAFFDVRIFNPFASTHLNQSLTSSFISNEKEKKRKYNQRVIDIEHGSFTPLVMSAYGGCSRETEIFIKMLAEKLSTKKDIIVCKIINWIRTKISFAIVRSAILCLRGSRNLHHKISIADSEIEISNTVGNI